MPICRRWAWTWRWIIARLVGEQGSGGDACFRAEPSALSGQDEEHRNARHGDDGAGDGQHPRHRTLAATFTWSYRTLDEQSARLLRRLSRQGGFGGFAYYCWGVGGVTLLLSLIR